MYQVLKQSRDVVRFRRGKLGADIVDLARFELVKHIHGHMIEEYKIEPDSILLEQLTKMVTNRVYGYITREEFHRQLRLSREDGGGGFDIYMAADLSRYLEKLIAQGVSHFTQEQAAKPESSNLHAQQAKKFEDMDQGLFHRLANILHKNKKSS